MDDDGLEVIDLTPEDDDGVAIRQAPRRLSGRRLVVAGTVVVAVVAVGGVVAHHQSAHKTATTPTTTLPSTRSPVAVPATKFVAPAGLAGLGSGQFVAIVGSTPVLVDGTGTPRRLLRDIPGNALVDTAQDGAALIGYESLSRVIVGPDFGGVRNTLPTAVELIPDADGHWWSNFGPLESTNGLRAVEFPNGTTPVAHLRNGYLLVDAARTGLFRWKSGNRLTRIATGPVRMLAIAGELVAWVGGFGSVVHVTNLTTRRSIEIPSGGYAVTARFAPDRSQLAILVGAHRPSVVLADSRSGRVITRFACSTDGGELDAFGNVPPAFDPVPFSWDAAGRLVLVCAVPAGLFVTTLDPTGGSVLWTTTAPADLRQLVFVGLSAPSAARRSSEAPAR